MPDDVATHPEPGEKKKERRQDGPPAYYDISLLKAPVWRPEVGVYFFLGGLSAGSFVLARLAERNGGGRFRKVTRAGAFVAAGAALPCAPLLILDLGDPRRFHHMLRVWKPGSPMNLGSWVLTAYTAVVALTGWREWLHGRRNGANLAGPARWADAAAGGVADAAGIPLALGLAGYTGVLLSTTATPVWSKNPWIGALFSASAVHSGSSAIRLVLELDSSEDASAGKAASREALAAVDTAASVAEAVCLGGYLAWAGRLAEPLTRGRLAGSFWGGAVAAGLALPVLLEKLPIPRPKPRWLRILGCLLALLGGYALRGTFVAAGRPSAEDPDAAREVSRSKDSPNENTLDAP